MVIYMRIAYLQNHVPFTESFAEACFSLTPKIYKNGPYELFLDISATEDYFGGEDPVLLKIEDLLASYEIEPHLTLVDKIQWARPLCQEPRALFPKGKSQDALLRLPIESLLHCGDPTKIEAESLERQKLISFMRRVGLTTIGSFASLPITAVNRRFGKLGVHLQEWVQGKREVTLSPLNLSDTLEEVLDADKIFSRESLLLEIRTSLERMERRLTTRQLAVKELKFLFYLESGKELVRQVALAEPMQEATQIVKYLKLFFETLEWDAPLSRLTVLASKTAPWSPGQLSLIDKTENKFHDLSRFVERLQKRLGEEAVGIPEIQESYVPERSWKKVWPPSSGSGSLLSATAGRPHVGLASYTPSFLERPLFLLEKPRPCSPTANWKLSPSENIAAEWWRGEGGLRRYFKAETPHGDFFWIFWNGKEWFQQGVYHRVS